MGVLGVPSFGVLAISFGYYIRVPSSCTAPVLTEPSSFSPQAGRGRGAGSGAPGATQGAMLPDFFCGELLKLWGFQGFRALRFRSPIRL